MGEYFKNIFQGFQSIFEGMTISFSHLFRKPITIQYPDKTARRFEETLPERFRGMLKVDIEICTACLACQVGCPIDCIQILSVKDEASKQRVMTRFGIDMAKCMYCGLCTEPCPTGAIHFTREFEGATDDLRDLVFDFVTKGTKVIPYKVPKLEKKGAV